MMISMYWIGDGFKTGILNSNQSITKLYLGISQDDIDDVYRLVEL
jgi:hypothetical protein